MIEFIITTTTSQHADELTDNLHLLGANAVTWRDAGSEPIYEPLPGEVIQWQDMIISAIFEDETLKEPLQTFLQQQLQAGLLKQFDVQAVEQKDWVRVSLDQFEPISFGQRLWICPSWQTPPVPDAVNVLLDPGLAFGTGTHPTTALCLEWLDANVKGGEQVLDYGCGSGILAVAALKLGAASAVGVDYDPQALEAAKMNAELNAISEKSLAVQLPEEFSRVTEKFDLILANILAKPLIELVELFAQHIKPNGQIILSGILATQSADVIAAYQPHFKLVSEVQKEEWIRLHFIAQA